MEGSRIPVLVLAYVAIHAIFILGMSCPLVSDGTPRLQLWQLYLTATSSRCKKCTDSDMVKAMKAVEDETLSISHAAAKFDVPRKTLGRLVEGKDKTRKKPRSSTVLTTEEEDALEAYLVYMAQCVFPLTRTMTNMLAWAVAKQSGIAHCFQVNTANSPQD